MAEFSDFLKASERPMVEVDTTLSQEASRISLRPELSRNGKIPNIEDLPENDRQFVSDIRDLEVYDRIQLVNSYVNGRIQFEEQEFGKPQDTRSYQNIMKYPKGDCDDYTYAKAVLLHHSGVEEVNIAGVEIQYHFEQGKSGIDPHALTIAKTPDGKYYAMDNLVDEPYEVGRDLRSVQNNLRLPENAADGPARAQIHRVLGVSSITPDGERYYVPTEPRPEPPKSTEPESRPLRYDGMSLGV